MKDPGKAVTLRTDTGTHTVTLTLADFNALKRFAGGDQEIRHHEKDFKRLRGSGLVTHRFDNSGDWPKALAELTPFGRQALSQEFSK